MKTVTELYVRDKANNDLTLSLDLFSSTGAQMVSSISSLFGPLVKGMMPVKHIVNRLGHIFKHIHYMQLILVVINIHVLRRSCSLNQFWYLLSFPPNFPPRGNLNVNVNGGNLTSTSILSTCFRVRNIFRGRFLTDVELKTLPHGLGVSLIKAVRILR